MDVYEYILQIGESRGKDYWGSKYKPPPIEYF